MQIIACNPTRMQAAVEYRLPTNGRQRWRLSRTSCWRRITKSGWRFTTGQDSTTFSDENQLNLLHV